MTDVLLFDIQKGSFVDGPGMRTTVFFKGCNLRCGWCHNPESQSTLPQLLHEEALCSHCGVCREVCQHPEHCILCGTCAEICPNRAKKLCGTWWSTDSVFEQILSDRTFYETTGGGVTFSGGECLLQPEGLVPLLKLCREHGIHTAVDTAGHVVWDIFERILPYTNLFLYDVKALDSQVHQAHIGADNRLILDNLARLLSLGKEVIVRIPVVAGVNDSPAQMRTLLQMLRGWGQPKAIELLPCHSMGSSKYRTLGREVPNYRAPTPQIMAQLNTVLTQNGF